MWWHPAEQRVTALQDSSSLTDERFTAFTRIIYEDVFTLLQRLMPAWPFVLYPGGHGRQVVRSLEA
jgi:hypothetical protein